jgi:hypothetical protein
MLELVTMLCSFNHYQDYIPIGMSGASEPPQSMTSWKVPNQYQTKCYSLVDPANKKLLTASPLLIWFAALRIQKLLVAQAVEME